MLCPQTATAWVTPHRWGQAGVSQGGTPRRQRSSLTAVAHSGGVMQRVAWVCLWPHTHIITPPRTAVCLIPPRVCYSAARDSAMVRCHVTVHATAMGRLAMDETRWWATRHTSLDVPPRVAWLDGHAWEGMFVDVLRLSLSAPCPSFLAVRISPGAAAPRGSTNLQEGRE